MGANKVKTTYFKLEEHDEYGYPYYKCEELGYSVNGVMYSEKVYRISKFDNYNKKWIGKLCFAYKYYPQLEELTRSKLPCSEFEVIRHIVKWELSK